MEYGLIISHAGLKIHCAQLLLMDEIAPWLEKNRRDPESKSVQIFFCLHFFDGGGPANRISKGHPQRESPTEKVPLRWHSGETF